MLVEMRETVIITGWEGRFNHQWECQLLPEQFLEDWPGLWVSRSLQWRRGSTVDCRRVRSAEYNSACTSPFEWGRHYLYYPYQFGLRSNNREGTQPCSSTENWIKDLLSMAPPIRTRPSFPHSHCLPSEASLSLLPLPVRGQTEWKPQSQKTNQTDHMDHSLVCLNETMSHAV